MSKARDQRRRADTAANNDPAPASAAPAESPPLKPRPGMFVLFAILLILLFAGLLALYFKTVYPLRMK